MKKTILLSLLAILLSLFLPLPAPRGRDTPRLPCFSNGNMLS